MQRLTGLLVLLLLPATLQALEGTFVNPTGLRIQMIFRSNGKVQVTSRIISAPVWYQYTQSGRFIYIEDPGKGQVEMEIRGETLWTSAAMMGGVYYPVGSPALAEAQQAEASKRSSDGRSHTESPVLQSEPTGTFDLVDLELRPATYTGEEYVIAVLSWNDSVVAFRTPREEHYGYLDLSEINRRKVERWMLLFRKDSPALIKEANRRLMGAEKSLRVRVRYLGLQSFTNYFGKVVEMPCFEVLEFRD